MHKKRNCCLIRQACVLMNQNSILAWKWGKKKQINLKPPFSRIVFQWRIWSIIDSSWSELISTLVEILMEPTEKERTMRISFIGTAREMRIELGLPPLSKPKSRLSSGHLRHQSIFETSLLTYGNPDPNSLCHPRKTKLANRAPPSLCEGCFDFN